MRRLGFACLWSVFFFGAVGADPVHAGPRGVAPSENPALNRGGNPAFKEMLLQIKALRKQDRLIEAEALARDAVNLAETENVRARERMLPRALGQLGAILRFEGRNAEAESVLREAYDNAVAAIPDDKNFVLRIQIQLGLALLNEGRYADADRVLRSALGQTGPQPTQDNLDVWLNSRVELGHLQTLIGNYGEANQLLTAALDNGHVTDDEEIRHLVIQAAIKRAILEQRQQKEPEAEQDARRAVSLADQGGEVRPSDALWANSELGKVLLKQGKMDAAGPCLEKAARLAERLKGAEAWISARAFVTLGQLLAQRDQPERAEQMFKKAIELDDRGASKEQLLMSLHSYAQFLVDQGRPKEAQPLYDRSLSLADQVFALSRGMNDAARERKIGFLRPLYSQAIGNQVKLDAEEPGQGHDRQALADVSLTQSRIFSEIMREAAVASYQGDPKFVDLKGRHDRLLHKLDDLQRRLGVMARVDVQGVQPLGQIDDPLVKARWQSAVDGLQKDIADKSAECDAVEAQLWQRYPQFMELDSPRPVQAVDLQTKWLKPGETLLAYYRLPHQLLIFLVSRGDFRLVRVRVEMNELDNLIAAARQPMESGGRLDALEKLDPAVLNRLYNLLIQPVAKSLPEGGHLLVVGDGPLYNLPMEMLVRHWDDHDKAAFRNASKGDLFEYALLDYADSHWHFAYWPSLAALAMQRSTPSSTEPFRERLVAFADPVFESGGSVPSQKTRAILATLGGVRGAQIHIPRLPETADEVKEVATILGGKHEIYLRDQAQEWQVKHDDLMGVQYLHFATHGLLAGEFAMLKGYEAEETNDAGKGTRSLEVTGDDDPAPPAVPPAQETTPPNAEPALILTLVGNLHGEDGLLTMSEVMNLKMDPDLVVLSACNTAGEHADTRNGEGFAGLVRAFMYAGAKGLLVSHWSVESVSTKDQITDIFRRVKSGVAVDDALANAHRAIRNSKDERSQLYRAHPFFWAPFVLVGT